MWVVLIERSEGRGSGVGSAGGFADLRWTSSRRTEIGEDFKIGERRSKGEGGGLNHEVAHVKNCVQRELKKPRISTLLRLLAKAGLVRGY